MNLSQINNSPGYAIADMTNQRVLYYAAAATTAAAGILHLMIVPNAFGFNVNNAVFFLVAGLAQLFWVVPVIRRWGTPWYIGGIAGTGVLIVLFAITRMPGNPIMGRGGPVNEMGIAIEVMQAAFMGLLAALITTQRMMKKLDENTARDAA